MRMYSELRKRKTEILMLVIIVILLFWKSNDQPSGRRRKAGKISSIRTVAQPPDTLDEAPESILQEMDEEEEEEDDAGEEEAEYDDSEPKEPGAEAEDGEEEDEELEEEEEEDEEPEKEAIEYEKSEPIVKSRNEGGSQDQEEESESKLKNVKFAPVHVNEHIPQEIPHGFAIANAAVSEKIVVATTLCYEGNMRMSVKLRQFAVLIKSILLFTDRLVDFHIVVDGDNMYNEAIEAAKAVTGNTPLKHQINFFKAQIWFPDKDYPSEIPYAQCTGRFKCADAKLFATRSLKDVEKVIYLDHDMIFVRGIQELWASFSHFTNTHMIGHSPSIINDAKQLRRNLLMMDYHALLKGFNAGVLLMHLDRMRSIPDGWVKNIMDAFVSVTKDTGGIIANCDAFVWNRFLHENFKTFTHELSCIWNFKDYQYCQERCKSAVNGLGAIHAVMDPDRSVLDVFKHIFDCYENLNIKAYVTKDEAKNKLVQCLKGVLSLEMTCKSWMVDSLDDYIIKNIRKVGL